MCIVTIHVTLWQSTIDNFSQEDIGKVIQNLNPNEAYGHENISVCLFKICGLTI